jgi:phage terminase small subunit
MNGILKNARHEHFATLVANGTSGTEAAKVAGYSEVCAHVTGCRLIKNAKVAARIEELRSRKAAQVTSSAGISKAWVIEKLRENAEKGMEEGQRVPAIRALELIGKELGMFVEQKKIQIGRLSEATPEQLLQLLTEIDQELSRARVEVTHVQ